MIIKLTKAQKKVVQRLLRGWNFLLIGRAGTGKSTIIREFKRLCKKNIVCLAPTGLAALLIGGETIHHFFSLKPADIYMPEDIGKISDQRRIEIIRLADVIIIDEISMLRSDLFAAIDYRLRQLADENKRNLPFGGKQIILSGDFLQLPPIVKNTPELNVSAFLEENYGGIYPFQTQVWSKAKFEVICLKQAMRQNDPEFLRILNIIRYGIKDLLPSALEALNECTWRIPASKDIISICTTNWEVDAINKAKLEKLSGKAIRCSAKISGTFPPAECPADKELELKVGESVMILANHWKNDILEYANGNTGVIEKIKRGSDSSLRVTVRLAGNRTVIVTPFRWSKNEYDLQIDPETEEKKLISKEVGAFEQIPLRAAYAITVHKAQGMTFPEMNLSRGRGFFANGHLYTALSRCSDLNKLYLSNYIMKKDVLVDPVVCEAYAYWEFDEELFADTLFMKIEELNDMPLGIGIPKQAKTHSQHWVMDWLQECFESYLTRQRLGEMSICKLSKSEAVEIQILINHLEDYKQDNGIKESALAIVSRVLLNIMCREPNTVSLIA